MRQSSRIECARAVAERYRRAGKRDKGRMLDEFCATTGYSRKYAIGLLRHPPAPRAARPPRAARARVYGPAEARLLRVCWELVDRICGKRLAPFLAELLERLAAQDALPEGATAAVVARVGGMSAATVDRLLGSARERGAGRGRGTTKPGTLLKQQVAIRTFAQWDDARPGFLEVDLVAHCGASGAGEFAFTVSGVDVATGWMACIAVRNKSEYEVFGALQRLRAELPFPLLGLDCDNGGEFINRNLHAYCQAEGITLTRSRPYRKNDQCHIEQNNWSVVRRLVGYGRFEGGGAVLALNRVHAPGMDLANFFQPVRKLVSKQRSGARVTKRYDAARTPFQRLLASQALPGDQAERLLERSATLHPVRLKLALEDAQQALLSLAVRSDPSLRHR